ncbi:hypothetical protein AM500_02660 [Bacillus sp. FJAT-18017]|uniref:hypothetical protein n=1 Tax=Bacillus sp. FJAT-18017 TaxID=1705566 RepID=UPI0006B03521|nr:hypothetical protein [Bacillus sp. FJAT-18017]ALC88821.1 hypothetical protein AM500_02660 [Bacillus sp. FJAT-18017]
MSEPIELTRIKINQVSVEDKIKEAYIGDFPEPIRFGVHSGVKKFYGATPQVEYPSTLDHIVAAAGG